MSHSAQWPRGYSALSWVVCVALTSGCVALKPGADRVRLAWSAQDLAGCTALGDIKVPVGARGTVDVVNARREFRNLTLDSAANSALVTKGLFGIPTAGVAYRCP